MDTDTTARTTAGLLVLTGALLLSACDLLTDPAEQEIVDTDFTATNGTWTTGFSDYSSDMADGMELTAGRRELPTNVDSSTVQADSALFLAGTNHSDDLFMYLKRPVEGLAENARYGVDYRIEIATAAPSDCVGIGGPPGEAVWVKGGAAPVEPTRRPSDGHLNVDKGNQSTGGSNAVVLGNIANSLSECSGNGIYTRKVLRSTDAEPLTVETSDRGTLWLFVGTESGFEGRTGLFYLRVRAVVERAEN